MPNAWTLHPQLEADATTVGDLKLSRLLAINHADYPWLVLVPRRLAHDPEKWKPVFGQDHAPPYIVEIADLAAPDATLLTEEIVAVSRVLKTITGCDKINVGAIGNVVPQLHVHLVARWKTDPLWPKPVWGMGAVRVGEAEGFARFVEEVRDGIKGPILSSLQTDLTKELRQ